VRSWGPGVQEARLVRRTSVCGTACHAPYRLYGCSRLQEQAAAPSGHSWFIQGMGSSSGVTPLPNARGLALLLALPTSPWVAAETCRVHAGMTVEGAATEVAGLSLLGTFLMTAVGAAADCPRSAISSGKPFASLLGVPARVVGWTCKTCWHWQPEVDPPLSGQPPAWPSAPPAALCAVPPHASIAHSATTGSLQPGRNHIFCAPKGAPGTSPSAPCVCDYVVLSWCDA